MLRCFLYLSAKLGFLETNMEKQNQCPVPMEGSVSPGHREKQEGTAAAACLYFLCRCMWGLLGLSLQSFPICFCPCASLSPSIEQGAPRVCPFHSTHCRNFSMSSSCVSSSSGGGTVGMVNWCCTGLCWASWKEAWQMKIGFPC